MRSFFAREKGLRNAMTMEEALERLQRMHPAAALSLSPLIAMYEAERFSQQSEKGRAARIRKALAEIGP